MDIQNWNTPPRPTRFCTPERSGAKHQSKEDSNYIEPAPNHHQFQTPTKSPNPKVLDSSTRRPPCKRSNLTLTGSARRKENPQSRHRMREQMEMEREEFEVSMFQLSRLEQDYELVKVLGSGNFSEVGLYRSRLSGQWFAIKQTKANRMSVNEVQALGSLWARVEQSPHVVRYFHSWVEEGQLYLVMEYCEDSLSHQIERRRAHSKHFSEVQIVRVLRAALRGIACLHNCHILHLDLKPENMLLHDGNLKIADFGLSRAAALRSPDVEEGDSRYLAREMLNVTPDIDLRKADIFSLAMTAYEMMTMEVLPNNGAEWQQIRSMGLKLQGRVDLPAYSPEIIRLVERMGAAYWADRPSAAECLAEKWMKESKRVSTVMGGKSSKKRDNSQ